MFRVLVVFFILNFYNPVFSSTKEKIISQMLFTNNLSFDFIQTINNKKESGRCIIKYPGKIWCEYDNSNKKIIKILNITEHLSYQHDLLYLLFHQLPAYQ